MRVSFDVEALPENFGRLYPDAGNLGVACQKMICQPKRESFGRFDRMQFGQGVYRVFHRVGRQHFAIVAFAVCRFEITFQANAEREFLDVVAVGMAGDLQNADALFSIIIFAKPDGHRSAPTIRGISKRTQQQRNVIVLLRILDFKDNDDLRVQTRNLAGGKVKACVKGQSINSRRQWFRRCPFPQAAIGVGRSPRCFCPVTPGCLSFQNYRNIRGGTAQRYIENVRCDVAHDSSNFSRRSRVILRCSSAATRNSVPGSFGKRCRSACRISSLDLPVAQIRKT